MEYISGMAMGDRVEKYLKDNKMYTPKNYRSAYRAVKNKALKIKNGAGKATRYFYYEEDITIVLDDWKKHLD